MKFALYLLGLSVLIFAFVVWAEATNRTYYECTDHGIVESITSMKYRTANVKLEDGRNIKLYQADVYPGKEVCIEGERKFDF